MTKEIANRILLGVLFITLVWGTKEILTVAVTFQDNIMLQQAMRCADPKTHKGALIQVITHEGGMWSCGPPAKLR